MKINYKNYKKYKNKIFLIFLCALACLFFADANASFAVRKVKKGTPAPSAKSQNLKTKNKTKNSVPNAAKKREAQIKSIVKLFTEVNPKLKNADAKNYAEYILEACDKFNQDAFAIAALIVHESTVNNKAVSRGGDYGLMQVRWKVHKSSIIKKYPVIKSAKDMFRPRENILIGTEIFANCRGNSDLKTGIRRYSSGNSKLIAKVTGTMNKLESYYKKFLN